METINFYRPNEIPYGCFSNFYRAPITIEGDSWQTSEHFFQAAKFFRTDPTWADEIFNAKTPSEAAQKGRDRKHLMHPLWEQIKDDVMRAAVLAKFTQHPELQKILLSTQDALLVEHTVNDSYWADGGNGTGKNMLGIILMEVREVILNNKVAPYIEDFKQRIRDKVR